MTEKILQIVETEDENYDGWLIKTTKQTIQILIANGQSCCENWGYFVSEDAVENYINSHLLSINIVDEALNVEKFEQTTGAWVDDAVFVNLETSKGTLQFAVYNSHNGYYGHEIKILSDQIEEINYL